MIKNKKGFTLLEILLVVAAIAILAGIVIVAINPAKQLGNTRNAQRRVDINTILNAVYQYMIDNGSVPTTILTGSCSDATNEICKTGASSCPSLINLDATLVTTDQTYLVSIPIDPTTTSTAGTGYRIFKTTSNRITVCAPLAENDATITATR